MNGEISGDLRFNGLTHLTWGLVSCPRTSKDTWTWTLQEELGFKPLLDFPAEPYTYIGMSPMYVSFPLYFVHVETVEW